METWSTVLHATRPFATMAGVAECCGFVFAHLPWGSPFPLSSMLLFAQGMAGQRHNVKDQHYSLLLIRHETDRQALPNRMTNDSSREDSVVLRLAPFQRCPL